MSNEEKNIRCLISNFDQMITCYPDAPEYTHLYVNFLRLLLSMQPEKEPLPVKEIMTIIRSEKPNIFYSLQQRGEFDCTFEFLTGLKMDVEKAEQRIDCYLDNT